MKAHTPGDWRDTEIFEAAYDRFGFEDYARVLAERVKGVHSPLTIGIYGRWGSGKTSLMRLIQEKLATDEGKKPTHEGAPRRHRSTVPKMDQVATLWINVWELSNRDQVWRAFLQSLLTQVHEKLPWPRRLAFDWSLFRQRVSWRMLLRTLIVNAYRIVIVVTPILLGLLAPDTGVTDANQLLAFALDPITGGGATLILGLWLLVRPAVEAAEEKVSLDLSTILKEAPYETQISELQKLRDQFERMVRDWVGEEGRLVVFIDDLDRCEPDKIPEVLEALKLFTTIRGCLYVMAVDHTEVSKGVAKKYDFSEDEGAEYLQKIVQVPFHLPPLDDDRIADFVRSDFPDITDKCASAPEVFSSGVTKNPREVKRTLNIYRTVLDVSDVRIKDWKMDPVDPELVAKMIVIQNRFRELYKELVREPRLVVELEEWSHRFSQPEEARQTGEAPRDDGELSAHPENQVPQRERPALAAMLQAGEKRFAVLEPDKLSTYIYLVDTAEGTERVRPSQKERKVLLGGHAVEIKAEVTRILGEAGNEEERQRIREAYVERLKGVLNDLDRYDVAERVSANIALGLLEGQQEFEPMMLHIPDGFFNMGTSSLEARELLTRFASLQEDLLGRETPLYSVNLPAYAIGRYPVTNAEFAHFIEDGGYLARGYWTDAGWLAKEDEGWILPRYWDDEELNAPGQPVVGISCYEAVAYGKWLAARTGKPYRLPSEAEWEKAARGTAGHHYPWGDEEPTPELCNFGEHVGCPTPTGQYSPKGDSPYGCGDMAGNVWEWTRSRLVAYDSAPEGGHVYQDAQDHYVLRGGAFDVDPRGVRCACRGWSYPRNRNAATGFRLVIDVSR